MIGVVAVMSSNPRRVKISNLISSRYANHPFSNSFVNTEALYEVPTRPFSWDERIPGTDVVQTVDGEEIVLVSDGMQSPPKPGWVLELTGGSKETGFTWTLYGISRVAKDRAA